MNTPLRWLFGIFLATCTLAVAAGVYGAWGGWRQILTAADRWAASAPGPTSQLVTKAGAVLDTANTGLGKALNTVNAPCTGSEPCRGTLGALNKAIIKVGDAVVTTQLEERKIAPHTIAAMDKFSDAAAALKGTADAGTDALTGLGPLLGEATDATANLDAFLKGDMLTKTLPDIAINLRTTTSNIADTTADVKSQVHKWVHPDKVRLTFWTATAAGGDWARHFMPSLF